MTPLLAFHDGSRPDRRGRFLAQIIEQDNHWLEFTHDYIQWVFPLTEFSSANLLAPRLTAEDIEAFRADPRLQGQMRAMLGRMLSFYGLRIADGQVLKGSHWEARKGNWFVRPTHNDLRITRILKSLGTLGLAADARMLLDGLERLVESEPDCGVCAEALDYWRAALTDK